MVLSWSRKSLRANPIESRLHGSITGSSQTRHFRIHCLKLLFFLSREIVAKEKDRWPTVFAWRSVDSITEEYTAHH